MTAVSTFLAQAPAFDYYRQMRFRLLCIGKLKNDFVVSAEREYSRRLSAWGRLEVEEIDNSRFSKYTAAEIKLREGELLLTEVADSDYLIALDEQGRGMSSLEFAEFLQLRFNEGRSTIVLAIGGPHGWDEAVLRRANVRLSLSKLTFTYELARLIVVEQVYRAVSILKGSPYHRQ